MKIKNGEAILGDCLEAIKTFENNCIDLTVTSPPYDNLRTYKGNLQWDFEGIARELYRVTKEGGVLVWVVGDATIKGSETGTSFKQALFFKEIGFNLHDTMIYRKSNRPPLNHPRYEQEFEYMFVFSKLAPKTVNLIHTECINAGKINFGTMRNQGSDILQKKHGSGKPCKKTKPLGNIWSYAVGTEKDNRGGKHPAIFPEKLAQDHILSWSNEGDTILDPFAGSFTTAKMAEINKRKWIMIEKEQEYFDIGVKRLNALNFN